MPLRTDVSVHELLIVTACSFVIGTVTQYARLKGGPAKNRRDPSVVFWQSISAGIAAAGAVSFAIDRYTINPTFIITISGLVGWAGVDAFKIGWDIFQTAIQKAGTKKGDEP